jgi:hypothetical protein
MTGNVPLWIALFVIAFAIGGCSKLKNDNRTATGGSGQANASSPSSSPASAKPAADAPPKPTTWEATATSLNTHDNDLNTFTLDCPPSGAFHSVWGSDIYTADSSICTAAVHSGLITYALGGRVTIELRKGRNMYGASERNGVTTSAYGPWEVSFVFKTPNTAAVVRAAEEATAVLWNTSATTAGFTNGQELKFDCPAGGKESSAWGTDIYTLDSSICTAAVHAGKIQLATGGPVTIQRYPGEPHYKGSRRNGIATKDYEHYDASFIVK